MAEEKKAVAQKAEKVVKAEAQENKFVAWCKKLPARIAKPFKNMYYEMKKVTWPSKRKWLAYSIIVLVFMLFMAVVISVFDMGSSKLVQWLGTLVK